MTRAYFFLLLSGAVLLAPAGLHAQGWHLPRLLPPTAGNEVAVYAVNTAPGGSLRGHWSGVVDLRHSGDYNVGLRLGYHDFGDDVTPSSHYVAGIETWVPLLSAARGAPADVAFTAGFGASWRGRSRWITLPLGVSVARAFALGPVTLVPFAHPFFTPELPDVSTDTGWGASLGADVQLRTGWSIRGDFAVGGDEALGLGIVWRLPPPAPL